MAKVLVFLATGFEEIEAVSIIDVLRRGGISVEVAGVDKIDVVGANGICIKADKLVDDVDVNSLDMVVLPGGWGGTDILATNEKVQNIIKELKNKDKYVGAICAAPFALDKAGVLENKFTCYPSVEEQISNKNYTKDEKVVIDGKVLTSRGPGTAICFGLAIVKELVGDDMYNQLKEGLLAEYC